LQNVPSVDYTGLYLQLSALNEQIEKLPLINLNPSPLSTANAAENLAWWRRGLQQTEKILRQLIVIRHTDNGMLPFITPEQKGFLYQNLHAMLQQAMFALIQKQPDIYRTSLQQATVWIKQYFIQDSPAVSAALSNLVQLQAVTIQTDVPSLQASMQAFQGYFAMQSKS
jgi:uroporphyrin-3 C-methyltransferase